MKLCIFAGTFNPIHNAHLKMGQYILDNFEFDKILFIPAYKPPHKYYDDDMSAHRLNMVKLATANNKRFEVSGIEYEKEEKSYTYLTILELYKRFNIEGKINFIIGTDAFEKIEMWYESEKLRQLVDFIVFVRENEAVNFDNLKEKGYSFKFAKMDFVDISSTELRRRIFHNESISGMVTKEVEDYIRQNGLYKN